MTDKTQALLPVTQADREAAAPFANCLSDMQDIFDGKADGLPVVQAFARHRQSHSLPGDVGTEAEAWLRAISDWLLANDHDMTLPSGVLDTDPLDIADRLAALTPSPCPGDVGTVDRIWAELVKTQNLGPDSKRTTLFVSRRDVENALAAALAPSALSGGEVE